VFVFSNCIIHVRSDSSSLPPVLEVLVAGELHILLPYAKDISSELEIEKSSIDRLASRQDFDCVPLLAADEDMVPGPDLLSLARNIFLIPLKSSW